MKKLMLRRQQISAVLRSLAAVAMADGELDPREFAYIEMHAGLFGVEDDIPLDPIDPEEVAELIFSPEVRAALIQRLVVMTMLDEQIHPSEIAMLRRFALALGVEEPAIEQMQHFVKGRMRLLAFDFGRRSFVGKQLRQTWQERGLKGAIKIARTVVGVGDAGVASRYLALGELPGGTLGRGFFDHCRSNGFQLPGEPKGPPEELIFHDIGHVLTGFGADPQGEVCMGGFESAYMGDDGFSVTLLALYAFHLGAPIIPKGHTTGAFDLEHYCTGLAVGKRLGVDLRKWDPWPHMDKPIDVVRAELGLRLQ